MKTGARMVAIVEASRQLSSFRQIMVRGIGRL